jgi:hypothetical protein
MFAVLGLNVSPYLPLPVVISCLKYRVNLCNEMLFSSSMTCWMLENRKQFQAEITLSLPAQNVRASKSNQLLQHFHLVDHVSQLSWMYPTHVKNNRPFSRSHPVPAYQLLCHVINGKPVHSNLADCVFAFAFAILFNDFQWEICQIYCSKLKQYLQERGVTVSGYCRPLIVELPNAVDSLQMPVNRNFQNVVYVFDSASVTLEELGIDDPGPSLIL